MQPDQNRSLLEWGGVLWERELRSDFQILAEMPSREAQRCVEVLRRKRGDAAQITAALLRRANLPKTAWERNDPTVLDGFESAMAVPSSRELQRDLSPRPPPPRKVRKAILARCKEVLGRPSHETGSTLLFERTDGPVRISTAVVCGGRLVDAHYYRNVFAVLPDENGWHRPLLSGISFLHLLGLSGHTVFNLMREGDEEVIAAFIARDSTEFFEQFRRYLPREWAQFDPR